MILKQKMRDDGWTNNDDDDDDGKSVIPLAPLT